MRMRRPRRKTQRGRRRRRRRRREHWSQRNQRSRWRMRRSADEPPLTLRQSIRNGMDRFDDGDGRRFDRRRRRRRRRLLRRTLGRRTARRLGRQIQRRAGIARIRAASAGIQRIVGRFGHSGIAVGGRLQTDFSDHQFILVVQILLFRRFRQLVRKRTVRPAAAQHRHSFIRRRRRKRNRWLLRAHCAGTRRFDSGRKLHVAGPFSSFLLSWILLRWGRIGWSRMQLPFDYFHS